MAVKVTTTRGRTAKKPKAPLDFRDPNAKGLGGILAGVGGGFSDLARGATNTLSDIGDFFGSRPSTTKAGDAVFGKGAPVKKGTRSRVGGGTFTLPGDGQAAAPTDQTSDDIGDLSSFLAKAMALINQNGGGGGSGTNYDAMRNQLRGQASDSDARIAAMYKQLQGSYANDAPAIAASYDQASQGAAQAADQGAAATKQGYDAARNSATQQLAALGIGDAAAVNAANGNLAAGDQGAAAANIAQNKAAVQQQLVTNKSNAGSYNTEIGQAAGLEGNLQRAVIQQQLAQQLAKLDTAQSSEQAQTQQNNFAQALQLAQGLYSDAEGKQSAKAKAQSDQQATEYQQYRDAQGDSNKRQQILATLYPALLKQYGGDDAKASAAAKALGLL